MIDKSGFEFSDRGDEPEFDQRSVAVRRAGAGAEAWRAALNAQQSAAPNHTDLYGLTRELVYLLGPVGQLMKVMSRQTAGYADSLPSDEIVYDDTRTDDPRELLARAAAMLDHIGIKTTAIALEMNAYWSLIGRIGVEKRRAGGDAGEVTP